MQAEAIAAKPGTAGQLQKPVKSTEEPGWSVLREDFAGLQGEAFDSLALSLAVLSKQLVLALRKGMHQA